ncbi:MAG TPA: valine--tRNA ligase [Ktedonobacterales bacterium]
MLPNRYDFREAEPRLAQLWADAETYAYDPLGESPTFTIDTPPATVSGQLHLGHCYSYTQADVIARYHRMRGERVFYPMGFDDNGLPTERFAEKQFGRKAIEMGRDAFIGACLELTHQTEDRFETLWRRLGLSIDWRFRYSTIAPEARRVSQWSFIQLHRAGHVYTQEAPTLWCPECQTAIAQAEVDDTPLPTRFTTLAFRLPDGSPLPISTTRPELLPACVAIFVHPDDARYSHLIGSTAQTPLCDLRVPILADAAVDPAKGSGAVMCCTFGDSTDVRWWRTHQLPLRSAIGRDGRMTDLARDCAGLSVAQARAKMLADLAAGGLILRDETIEHTVGAHERCGTPVEYLLTRQWFVRILDQKPRLLEAGRRIHWHPEHMRTRYEHWVENLQWDWCISRQRYFGVPFPAWTCRACGATMLAELDQLPIDPRTDQPPRPCACGAHDFVAEPDVMDTWATSSCTPLILARWPDEPDRLARHFPASLHPQAHDIIRTWAFYSIVQALYHTGEIPWRHIMISGHGLSSERRKISKSKDHHEAGPLQVIEEESADGLRYWATAARTGADSPFTAETLATGRRLITKLWNAGRFAERTLADFSPAAKSPALLPADRWMLAQLGRVIQRATADLDVYEYASARTEIERFFWSDLCDNYLELVKARLYGSDAAERAPAQWTLYRSLLATLKLLAPYLPYVTEELYQYLFRANEGSTSIHLASWPHAEPSWLDVESEAFGAALLDVLGQVRRYKAERGLSVGAELAALRILAAADQHPALRASLTDLRSATRARDITLVEHSDPAAPIGVEPIDQPQTTTGRTDERRSAMR